MFIQRGWITHEENGANDKDDKSDEEQFKDEEIHDAKEAKSEPPDMR